MKLITICPKTLVDGLANIRDINNPDSLDGRIKVTPCYLNGHFWQKSGVMDGGVSFHQNASFRSHPNDREAWLVEYPRVLSDVVRNRLVKATVVIEIEGSGMIQNTADKRLLNIIHTGKMIDDYVVEYDEVASNEVYKPPVKSLSKWVASMTRNVASMLG